jgi:hypothetical protein
MSKINYLGLDGFKLRTFITVLEEESVSKAAIRLKVTQSAVYLFAELGTLPGQKIRGFSSQFGQV